MVDPSAEFYGYEGSRDIITIVTDGEKDPLVMGFKLASDEPVAPQQRDEHGDADIELAPEDEIRGQEIDSAEHAEGAEVPQEGRLVMVPSPTDKVEVNGVELTMESSLQALGTALTARGLSTSGSKQKCFQRLLNFQKKTELEILSSAVAKSQKSSIAGGAGQAQLDALSLPALVPSMCEFSSQSRCAQNNWNSTKFWKPNNQF